MAKVVMAGWEDVPHLSEKDKKELYDSYPPHMRDARTKGVPQLGAGAIYPVDEKQVMVDDFPLPKWWPRVYGLDVGWNTTAGAWGAWNQEADVLYIYAEYYRGQAEPAVHAAGVKAKGEWIPGVIDPASRGRSQDDGKKLVDQYLTLGLNLFYADNAVDAGINEMYGRLSTGRLKVFRSCSNFWTEYRLYRRSDKGNIVKELDHLMDASRYLIMSGLAVAMAGPMRNEGRDSFEEGGAGRDSITGY